MWKFKRNSKQVPKQPKQNNAPSGKPSVPMKQVPSGSRSAEDLNQVQKNITRQAILAGLTVVLTIVILFAMTSAWYTNIVETSNLVFEVESWGFDGEITVGQTITAAPGDSGAVNLEVQNTSQNISAISVNASKLNMIDEMQQRLYLYVDTHMNRDGETMDRVYLNSQEGYTYTVFANGNLTLTESVSNAPQLKWQWVYDVLGYYVLAQSREVEGVDKTTVQEYLRPIEYDYDEATTILSGSLIHSTIVETETEEEGSEAEGGVAEAAETGEETETGEATETTEPITMELVTVDGTRSPEKFLVELSKTDGYEGTIDPTKVTDDGYYPVAVDEETGYGVYAYLCNYTEIQNATAFDTELGRLASEAKAGNLTEEQIKELQYTVTLTISAQQNESKAINVTTLDSLQKAITGKTADVVQLSDNIGIPAGQSLVIPENTRVMVDLNGKEIRCESNKAIEAQRGSSLTLINGKLTGLVEGGTTYGVYTTGAEVVMSQVDVTGFQNGIYLGDQALDNPMDSRVHMVGCNVTADYYAVYINGNGAQSAQKTQLLIDDCELSSNGLVLTSNGNSDRYGTDVQIMNSKLTQTSDKPGTAIYQPQKESTLRIYNSQITGYTGIAIKAGSVDILKSTITGTGIETVGPAFGNSGFSDTGDAVYIETNYGHEILLTIQEESVLTTNENNKDSRSLRVFEEDATNVSVKIYSGTFDEAPSDEYIAEGSIRSGTKVSVQTQ